MFIKAPLMSAKSAMAENTTNGTPRVLSDTTFSRGPLDSASCPVGTTIEAVKVTSK